MIKANQSVNYLLFRKLQWPKLKIEEVGKDDYCSICKLEWPSGDIVYHLISWSFKHRIALIFPLTSKVCFHLNLEVWKNLSYLLLLVCIVINGILYFRTVSWPTQTRSNDEKTFIISQVQIEGEDFNSNNFLIQWALLLNTALLTDWSWRTILTEI